MSHPLAIATATATLRHVVAKALPSSGFLLGVPEVSHVRPDADLGLPPVGVNVCLYRVSPNPNWRNADLPTRRGTTVLRKPQIGLDLYYLLSFYGNDKELEPQRLLGYTVNALHADPQLPRDVMRNFANPAHALHLDYLLGSDLGDQPELVRITPTELSLEELTKLWSVFFQTKYVLSVAYTATVVLIEADLTPAKPAPPVETTQVLVRPTPDPRIDDAVVIVIPAVAPATDPRLGVHLQGENLMLTLAKLGAPPGTPVQPSEARFPTGTGAILVGGSNAQLDVALPTVLKVGEQWVQIVNTAGDADKTLAASNVAAFTLRPHVMSVELLPAPPRRLRANLLPAVDATQPVTLVLIRLPSGPRFEIPVTTRPTTTQMVFDLLPAITPGQYRLAIDVAGFLSDNQDLTI